MVRSEVQWRRWRAWRFAVDTQDANVWRKFLFLFRFVVNSTFVDNINIIVFINWDDETNKTASSKIFIKFYISEVQFRASSVKDAITDKSKVFIRLTCWRVLHKILCY